MGDDLVPACARGGPSLPRGHRTASATRPWRVPPAPGAPPPLWPLLSSSRDALVHGQTIVSRRTNISCGNQVIYRWYFCTFHNSIHENPSTAPLCLKNPPTLHN